MSIPAEYWNQFVELVKVLSQAGFGGGVISLLVSVLTTAQMPNVAKEMIVAIACAIASFFLVLANGVDVTNLVVVVPAMIFACRKLYQDYFKPTGIGGWIEQITTLQGR